jgi:uncharacterized membrane protein
MRNGEAQLIVGAIILAVLMALNLLHVFRNDLGKIARYLTVMAFAGSGTFSFSAPSDIAGAWKSPR